MSTHYLIDLFAPVLSGATILDIIETPTGQSPLMGNFVVRLPEGIPVSHPVNLGDLLTQKYEGYLAFYPSFTRIAYDDLLDTTDIDLAALGTSGMFGQRSAIKLNPGGLMQSLTVALTGGAPSQVLVTWETYTTTVVDPVSANLSLSYQELPSDPSHVTCQVSFDNGVTWLSTMDSAILNVPPVNRGTNFKIRLTNASAQPLNIGSWALVY